MTKYLATISIFFILHINGQKLDSLERYNYYKSQVYLDLINKLESGLGNCDDYNKYSRTKKDVKIVPFTKKIAEKYNCKQAYQDLYTFYFLLNKKLSNEKNLSCDTLLLENLDKSSRKSAIKALLRADIDKSTIATYYYFGVYVKKNRKKAIALYRSDYQYEISDKKIIEELESNKNMFVPCQ